MSNLDVIHRYDISMDFFSEKGDQNWCLVNISFVPVVCIRINGLSFFQYTIMLYIFYSPPVRSMASIGKFNEGKLEHKDGVFFLYLGDGNLEIDLYVWNWFFSN